MKNLRSLRAIASSKLAELPYVLHRLKQTSEMPIKNMASVPLERRVHACLNADINRRLGISAGKHCAQDGDDEDDGLRQDRAEGRKHTAHAALAYTYSIA
jgi:hypothetical protein